MIQISTSRTKAIAFLCFIAILFPESIICQKCESNGLFPVYDITLGKTTLAKIRKKGYTFTEDNRGFTIEDASFSDMDQDSIVESMYLLAGHKIPQKWVDSLGLNWHLSYNELYSLLENKGFTVIITEEPTVKGLEGRKYFYATVSATSSVSNNVELSFDFFDGNRNGEGYTANSPNSLYSISAFCNDVEKESVEDVLKETYKTVYLTPDNKYYYVMLDAKKIGIFDLTGKEIIPCIYEYVIYYTDYFYYKSDNESGYFDLNGHKIADPQK